MPIIPNNLRELRKLGEERDDVFDAPPVTDLSGEGIDRYRKDLEAGIASGEYLSPKESLKNVARTGFAPQELEQSLQLLALQQGGRSEIAGARARQAAGRMTPEARSANVALQQNELNKQFQTIFSSLMKAGMDRKMAASLALYQINQNEKAQKSDFAKSLAGIIGKGLVGLVMSGGNPLVALGAAGSEVLKDFTNEPGGVNDIGYNNADLYTNYDGWT